MLPFKKSKLKNEIFDSLKSTEGYSFLESDIDLFVTEKHVKLPAMKISESTNDGLESVSIRNHTIYWPKTVSTRDLPWLYHEVFDNFSKNPSSYDNRSLSYNSKEWIFDCGAAEGYFSLFALAKAPGKVFAIEPLSIMNLALTRTLSKFQHEGRAVVIQAALGEIAGKASIRVDGDHLCSSNITVSDECILSTNLTTAMDEDYELVEVLCIDDLVSTHSLKTNGLIKMDIEGYEMLALRGASKTLNLYKPALAIAVYHEYDNALLCADIIKQANPDYTIQFRGHYGYVHPARPYMIFAY